MTEKQTNKQFMNMQIDNETDRVQEIDVWYFLARVGMRGNLFAES